MALPIPLEDLRETFSSILKLDNVQEVRSSGFKKSQPLRKKLGKISWAYRGNLGSPTAPRPDFSLEINREAYMYSFMARHSYLTYKAASGNEAHLFPRYPLEDSTSMCAIGGGPGSDIIGLVMAYHRQYPDKSDPFVDEVHVLDRCTEWEQSWNSLVERCPKRLKQILPEVHFKYFDFLDANLSTSQKNAIRKAKIVTMIKSLSPVTAMLHDNRIGDEDDANNGWNSLHHIIDAMSPGAVLLYIDNKHGTQRQDLEDALRKVTIAKELTPFKELDSRSLGKSAWLPAREQSSNLNNKGYSCYQVTELDQTKTEEKSSKTHDPY
ncbi:hypothetical protein HOLleu_26035 [Holothuria leucospilota]|uniref:Uncharacterized protein n=1 Tax=Holothuria leucospilota TaxID=206669 RepID=A0A9Q1BSR6_HOLLE|nr:hypothetical protein HOLleu_26035 [Holothuria leucospilota]